MFQSREKRKGRERAEITLGKIPVSLIKTGGGE